MLLGMFNAASQPCRWLEGLLLTWLRTALLHGYRVYIHVFGTGHVRIGLSVQQVVV